METEDSHNTAVVVADNRETVLQAVSTTLEKAGFTVLPASSGAEALQYCRARAHDSRHAVQLAIIDATTDGLNVAELVGQLDAISPGMRTLFLTAGDEEQSLRGIAAPGRVRGFLHKPFRRAHLLGQVLEMMDRPLALTA
ncbi:MAG TPA: response regulator [Bryobacteraceae bacterium]|jgi:CheY-like chemotaxis protein|nr:response regulator [Bryobacteraceae bacterium]